MIERVDFDADGSIVWHWGAASLDAPQTNYFNIAAYAATLALGLASIPASVCLILAWQCAQRFWVVGERLVVTPHVGVEAATMYLGGRMSRQSEAIECITDVVINEVIHQCSVRCCVTIVAADGRLIVPFKQVRAPLATVASIVSSIQEVLPASRVRAT